MAVISFGKFKKDFSVLVIRHICPSEFQVLIDWSRIRKFFVDLPLIQWMCRHGLDALVVISFWKRNTRHFLRLFFSIFSLEFELCLKSWNVILLKSVSMAVISFGELKNDFLSLFFDIFCPNEFKAFWNDRPKKNPSSFLRDTTLSIDFSLWSWSLFGNAICDSFLNFFLIFSLEFELSMTTYSSQVSPWLLSPFRSSNRIFVLVIRHFLLEWIASVTLVIDRGRLRKFVVESS